MRTNTPIKLKEISFNEDEKIVEKEMCDIAYFTDAYTSEGWAIVARGKNSVDYIVKSGFEDFNEARGFMCTFTEKLNRGEFIKNRVIDLL